MNAKLVLRGLTVFIGLASSALAQIDAPKFAADLRAKYGPPLAREAFLIPAGEMVVDYAANGNVCRIRLPAMAPVEGRQGVKSTGAMEAFIAELVPPALRGQELRRMASSSGIHSVSMIEYENVIIARAHPEPAESALTITFKAETCQGQIAH